MPERSQVSRLARIVRAALHRLIAGIRVSRVPNLAPPHIKQFSPALETGSSQAEYAISCEAGSPEYSLSITSPRELPPFPVQYKVVDIEFEMEPQVDGIVDEQHVQISEVCWDSLNPQLSEMDIIWSTGECVELTGFRFKACSPVENLPILIGQGHVSEVGVDTQGIPHRDLEAIYNAPMIVNPTPWKDMERGFIVKCWDRLRRIASEKLGHDPGRDLEMIAVFRKVDFSYVRRSKYDAGTKELRVFVGSPSRAAKSELGRCAIIIGLVRNSGEILQVAMPLAG